MSLSRHSFVRLTQPKQRYKRTNAWRMPMELQCQRPVAERQRGCKSHHRESGVAEQQTRRICVSSSPCRRGFKFPDPGECRRNYSASHAQVAGSNPVAAATHHPEAGYSCLSDRCPKGNYGCVAQSEEQVMFRHLFVAGTDFRGLARFGRAPHPDRESRRVAPYP